ncbi:MAG: hypothetical protein LBR15_01120 [Methanobrevibacter sp.]|jgi:hypothetical protein|nr:hypothetical protein [Candidatus Methanovirga australis]
MRILFINGLFGWNDNIKAFSDKVGYIAIEDIVYENDSLLCTGINLLDVSFSEYCERYSTKTEFNTISTRS